VEHVDGVGEDGAVELVASAVGGDEVAGAVDNAGVEFFM